MLSSEGVRPCRPCKCLPTHYPPLTVPQIVSLVGLQPSLVATCRVVRRMPHLQPWPFASCMPSRCCLSSSVWLWKSSFSSNGACAWTSWRCRHAGFESKFSRELWVRLKRREQKKKLVSGRMRFLMMHQKAFPISFYLSFFFTLCKWIIHNVLSSSIITVSLQHSIHWAQQHAHCESTMGFVYKKYSVSTSHIWIVHCLFCMCVIFILGEVSWSCLYKPQSTVVHICVRSTSINQTLMSCSTEETNRKWGQERE